MNKHKALEELRSYLEKYLQDSFKFHIRFINELKTILLSTTGNEKAFFSLLIKQLSYVKSLKRNIHQADSNEILKYQNNNHYFYSLHLQTKTFNVRLLMSFDEDDNPVFLAAFNEKSGKNHTDYSSWNNVLKNRICEVLESEVSNE